MLGLTGGALGWYASTRCLAPSLPSSSTSLDLLRTYEPSADMSLCAPVAKINQRHPHPRSAFHRLVVRVAFMPSSGRVCVGR
jgi:hypothetical protein